MRLELPFPPPAGSLYRERPGGRRPRREAYETWRHLALWQLSRQVGPLELNQTDGRPVALDLTLARPRGRGCSLSELAPALEEILIAGGLVANQSLIQEIRLRWTDPDPTARHLAVLATRDVRRHLMRLSNQIPARKGAHS